MLALIFKYYEENGRKRKSAQFEWIVRATNCIYFVTKHPFKYFIDIDSVNFHKIILSMFYYLCPVLQMSKPEKSDVK